MLFISFQKLFSFSRYLNFLSSLFGHVSKRLGQKNNFNFKLYELTAWLTSSCNTHISHILYVSRRKGNQTMKIGQLIEYKMRNIFLEKSYTKCGRDTSPRPFFGKYLWINSLRFYIVCFYCMSSCVLSKYIETKLQTACFYLV